MLLAVPVLPEVLPVVPLVPEVGPVASEVEEDPATESPVATSATSALSDRLFELTTRSRS
jgi:hypothetical protein